MIKIFFVLMAAAFANGNRVGNGGNLVVCEENGRRRIELLDFYESSGPWRKIGSADENQIIDETLSALQKIAPALAKNYRDRFERLQREIEYKENIQLVSSQDSFHLIEPLSKKCRLQQAATRRNSRTDGKKFIFSQDLWKDMPARERAGLWMHEIVYDHFAQLGEKDSLKARKMVAYLFSERIIQESPVEFWAFVGRLRVPLYREEPQVL
ncbi:MAG: hypothetical protein KF802_08630 [Bdellovibrionaceae bacterium]|nr:hypothetical protein [Pseudobdellovibrionaceae bacterium]MBX3034113.1 hypothetical protein [Pseudobdellovibrionaceae bacterium]